jgi:tetratricopeptide (TPR) repeat protein
MVSAARRQGRLAVPIETLADLLRELSAGYPVIVFQNLGLDWYPRWHYAVAIGYDLRSSEIVLHSGGEARSRMPLATFEHTWRRAGDWALLVLPPDRLPTTGGEMVALRAANGLEQAKQYKEAAISYAAIAREWPDSLTAQIGLGNARHGSGDLAGAEKALRAALARHPDAAPAWNNLAVVLAELGQRQEARAAALRALSLSGGTTSPYRETLELVSRGAN